MAPTGSAASRARPARPIRGQVRLAGPSPALDHRRHAFRRDLADVALASGYAAAAYAQPQTLSCNVARTMVRKAPRADGEAGSELLLGESFLALEVGGEWAWGYCGVDRYVGYVPAAALSAETAPTHRVSAVSALLFREPDLRSAHVDELPLGARAAPQGREGAFHAVDGGYIHDRHLAPIDRVGDDWVEIAKLFVGTPYLWGGRTRWGIDCSGLVQIALGVAGVAAPRDSDMQADELGRPVDMPRRGDLAFFPGHVGIMVDETHLLHANAYWMSTVIEPLAIAAERSGRDARPLTGLKRL
jgi:cell wall-associated NlpC family hydrolase